MRGQARPAPPCSVVEADCQVVVVREFVPEVEHERAVVQEVAGDDVVRIDVPDFFNSFGGSHKHLHGVTSVLWSLMRQGWGCLSRGAGLSTAEGLRWRGENLVGLGWGGGCGDVFFGLLSGTCGIVPLDHSRVTRGIADVTCSIFPPVRDKGGGGKPGQLPGEFYHLRRTEREDRCSVAGAPEISIDVGIRGYGLPEG